METTNTTTNETIVNAGLIEKIKGNNVGTNIAIGVGAFVICEIGRKFVAPKLASLFTKKPKFEEPDFEGDDYKEVEEQ